MMLLFWLSSVFYCGSVARPLDRSASIKITIAPTGLHQLDNYFGSMGRLSGVMDDRGKYIYISPEEMKAVADSIKRQGRVSISHLASKSNQFIDLDPKPQLSELSTDCIAVA